jgi:soluble lytic murein transglycosylase-like protein
MTPSGTARPAVAGWLIVSVVLAAMVATARAGSAQPSTELRVARLSPPPHGDATVAWADRRPARRPLGNADLVRYRELFALQRRARWEQADRIIASLDDPLLLGHVLAERYLHPTAYRASYAELASWLGRYGDLPQAARVHRLALERRPPGAAPPAAPLKLKARTEEVLPPPATLVGRVGNPHEQWRRAITAWRDGGAEMAARRFARLATAEGLPHDDQAAAAFWAARACSRAGQAQQVARYLRLAARDGEAFYGLLARKMLDGTADFDWREDRVGDGASELGLHDPAVRRAVALAQVGEPELADEELQRVVLRARPELGQTLLALALTLELPSAQRRLAGKVRRVDGRRRDGAAFPVPSWRPAGGYQLDPTFVHAVIRAESGFDPRARSPKGALGLMQVMPETARLVAEDLNLAYGGDRWLMQPSTNMKIGQAWLKRLAAGKTVNGSLIHLIAAYNAGEGRVADWAEGELKLAGDDPLLYIESVPIAETRDYVKRVLANLWAYQARARQGMPSLQALAENRWPQVELVTASGTLASIKERTRHARAN